MHVCECMCVCVQVRDAERERDNCCLLEGNDEEFAKLRGAEFDYDAPEADMNRRLQRLERTVEAYEVCMCGIVLGMPLKPQWSSVWPH